MDFRKEILNATNNTDRVEIEKIINNVDLSVFDNLVKSIYQKERKVTNGYIGYTLQGLDAHKFELYFAFNNKDEFIGCTFWTLSDLEEMYVTHNNVAGLENVLSRYMVKHHNYRQNSNKIIYVDNEYRALVDTKRGQRISMVDTLLLMSTLLCCDYQLHCERQSSKTEKAV